MRKFVLAGAVAFALEAVALAVTGVAAFALAESLLFLPFAGAAAFALAAVALGFAGVAAFALRPILFRDLCCGYAVRLCRSCGCGCCGISLVEESAESARPLRRSALPQVFGRSSIALDRLSPAST